jgi:hypothetical protein
MQFVDAKTGFAFTPAWARASYGDLDRRSGTVANLFTTNGGQTWEPITPQLAP